MSIVSVKQLSEKILYKLKSEFKNKRINNNRHYTEFILETMEDMGLTYYSHIKVYINVCDEYEKIILENVS